MKSTEKWVRLFLGVYLVLYALNKFVHVLPTSYGAMPETTRDFLDAIVMYLPFLYFFEMLVGVLLILNKWTSLILIMLFPLSIAFMMFNFLNADMIAGIPAILVAGSNVILILARKEQYKMLLH